MPVTKSTEYAKFNAVGLNQRPDSIQAQGRIRFLNDTITLIGDETTGVVNLLPLPKGALVDPTKSYFILTATTGMTVDVGVAGVADNLADGVALTSAGSTVFAANEIDLVEATTGDLTLTFKSGTASATTIRVSVAYYVR
jgi:hypothetical protein